MLIKKAQFIMGMTEKSPALNPTIPQIAFIGRSNVGKSSTINSLTNNKNLAKTSNYPGRTQQINVFLINDSIYFIDLPGYGYTKTSQKTRNTLSKLINWYFLESTNEPKLIIFIIDANVGPTANDQEMLNGLTEIDENIIIVANKTDKIKQSEYSKKIIKVREFAKNHKIIEFSADKKRGVTELLKAIF